MDTPTVRLATVLLKEPLAGWVAERRQRKVGWDTIAAELATATEQQVACTGEWLRRLYGPLEKGEVASDEPNGSAA